MSVGQLEGTVGLKNVWFQWTAVVFFLSACWPPLVAAQTNLPPTDRSTASASPTRITAYTLTPERYRLAHGITKTFYHINLFSIFYGIASFVVILRLRVAPKYRTWAEGTAANGPLQALIFAPLLILTIDVLKLPIAMYGHSVARSYGLSLRGWASWFQASLPSFEPIRSMRSRYSFLRSSPTRKRHCACLTSFQ